MGLDVHLRGDLIGTLFSAGDDDYRFAYRPELAGPGGAGTAALSTALPPRAEPYSFEATRAFVGGLLPEGAARERLARTNGLDPSDGFGLLASAGEDCPGAVVIVPEGQGVDDDDVDQGSLSDADLEQLLRASPEVTEGPSLPFSLPGSRHKLALALDGREGRWRLPSAAVASTHVLKPEAGDLPHLVRNEMFCMEVARAIGLPVAAAALQEIGGRECLVSRRFDRDGPLRVHQEDFCQALGYTPAAEAEDEEALGPGFAEASGLLRAVGRERDIALLIAAALFNYAIGNGDTHGANFALLHGLGGPRLAPLHDLASTVVYGLPIHVGMVLSDDYDQAAYLLEIGWVCEECEFDIDELRALATVLAKRIVDAVNQVADRARQDGWHAPVIDDIVALASTRATELGFEVDY